MRLAGLRVWIGAVLLAGWSAASSAQTTAVAPEWCDLEGLSAAQEIMCSDYPTESFMLDVLAGQADEDDLNQGADRWADQLTWCGSDPTCVKARIDDRVRVLTQRLMAANGVQTSGEAAPDRRARTIEELGLWDYSIRDLIGQRVFGATRTGSR